VKIESRKARTIVKIGGRLAARSARIAPTPAFSQNAGLLFFKIPSLEQEMKAPQDLGAQ
jgi:hypothetical protein